MNVKAYLLSGIFLCSSLLIFSAPQQRPQIRTPQQEARCIRNRISAKKSRLNADARLQQAHKIIANGGINRPYTQEESTTINKIEAAIEAILRAIRALPANTTKQERNRLSARLSRLRKNLICVNAGLLPPNTPVPPLPQTLPAELPDFFMLLPLLGDDDQEAGQEGILDIAI